MGRKEMLHPQVDHLPLNANKVRMICDLMEEPEDRLEFFLDFAAYHDRWWDLDQADFERVINVQKGAEIAFDVVPPSEEEWQEALYVEQLAQEYEDAYADWNEDYRRYTEYKLGIMEDLESLDKYLMMCADPAFDYCVYVNGKADIWKQNGMYLPLLDNVSRGGAKCLEQAAASESDYLMIVKKEETGGCQEFLGVEARKMAMHCFPEMAEDGSVSVQILVMDGQDGGVLHEKRFDNKLVVYSE